MSCTRFLDTVLPNWVKHTSIEDETYHVAPELELCDWDRAVAFSQSERCKLIVVQSGRFYVPSSEFFTSLKGSSAEVKKAVTAGAKEYKVFLKEAGKSATTFKKFIQLSFRYFVMYESDENVQNAKYVCSCPIYGRYMSCHHSLGFMIARGEVKVPTECDTTKVGQVRGPGRPRKAKSAWQVD